MCVINPRINEANQDTAPLQIQRRLVLDCSDSRNLQTDRVQKGVEIGNGIIEEAIGKIIPDIRGREAPVYHSIIVVEKLGPKFPVVFQKLRIYGEDIVGIILRQDHFFDCRHIKFPYCLFLISL